MKAHDADLLVHRTGSDAQDRVGVTEEDGYPARPVVDPLGVDHIAAIEVEPLHHDGERRLVDRTLAQQWRRRERQPLASLHRDQADSAFLHDSAGLSRLAPGLEPCVAGAERRMAGKGQLATRREDAHPIVGVGRGRAQEERRLGEVRPVGERLHLGVAEVVRVVHHGEAIPPAARRAEDVNLAERMTAHICSLRGGDRRMLGFVVRSCRRERSSLVPRRSRS